MEYERWAPHYRRVAEDFGFAWEREQLSARVLENLLRDESRLRTPERLEHAIRRRSAVVVGLAPNSPAPPLHALQSRGEPPCLIAADGATDRCLDVGLVPDLIVTDLDGPIPAQVSANARGALVLAHAHGDNLDAIRRWLPEFPGSVGGSWAGPPRGGLVNYGGFTDGDRAAFLAVAMGATEVLLSGFDFEAVEETGPAGERKRRKLGWARSLLGLLAGEGTPLFLLRADGSRVPYPTDAGMPSTQ
ncbi:MAG: DUF115 domain-containing protein [Thermoplasmata archaeon]|nr:DUF115 domain-containing protein [Thermoplasmata archaeon]MCI4341794.1 DUF115 domain-containing protein [Thermoplasmata archaeon]